jgi:hypothetical protein
MVVDRSRHPVDLFAVCNLDKTVDGAAHLTSHKERERVQSQRLVHRVNCIRAFAG